MATDDKHIIMLFVHPWETRLQDVVWGLAGG